MRRHRILAAVLVAAVALCGVAIAQVDEGGNIAWLSVLKTKPGKGMDLVQTTVKHDAAMYDELLKNGTINGWGIAMPINHRKGDSWNHLLWVDMDDWSKVGQLQAGFMKLFASRTPEQSKKIEAEYKASVVEGSHYDWLVKNVVQKGVPDAAPPRYFGVGYWRANPGAGDTVTEFYKTNVAPIYDKLLADGVISSYGMFTQSLHTDPSWTHVGWYGMSDLGSVDKVQDALQKGLADVDMSGIMEAMDPEGHWDQILLVGHLGGQAAGE